MPPKTVEDASLNGWGNGDYPEDRVKWTLFMSYQTYLMKLEPRLLLIKDYAKNNEHWLPESLVAEANTLWEVWTERMEGWKNNPPGAFMAYMGIGRDQMLKNYGKRLDDLASSFTDKETYITEQKARGLTTANVVKPSRVPAPPRTPAERDAAVAEIKKMLKERQGELNELQPFPTNPSAYLSTDFMEGVPYEWMHPVKPDEETTLIDTTRNSNITFEVRLQKIIGEGSFGVIYEVELEIPDKEGRKIVAVKKPVFAHHRNTDNVVRRLVREMKLIKDMGEHENIIPIYGGFWIDSIPHAVFGFSPYGNVLQYIDIYPNADRLFLLRGTASGIAFIHSKGGVHCDIGPLNVVVSPEGSPWVIDFGLSKGPQNPVSSATVRDHGYWEYKAPEIIENFDITDSEQYTQLSDGSFDIRGRLTRTKETDVYAFGILTWIVLVHQPGFRRLSWVSKVAAAGNTENSKQAVKEGNLRPDLDRVPSESNTTPSQSWDEAKRLMASCWAQSAADRPEMSQVAASL